MTPAQAAWLRKLRDEGPQVWRDIPMEEYGLSRQNGWERLNEQFRFIVTPAGLAALSAYEEQGK